MPQHEGGCQEQDQPLQAHRNVLQPQEIEHARHVIADQAQEDQAPAVLGRQGGPGPHLPKCNASEHGDGKQHAEGDHGDRVELVAVQQLGDNGLGGKQHGARNGDGQAGQQGRAGNRCGGGVHCAFAHASIVIGIAAAGLAPRISTLSLW
jgi:hypothetical protein